MDCGGGSDGGEVEEGVVKVAGGETGEDGEGRRGVGVRRGQQLVACGVF